MLGHSVHPSLMYPDMASSNIVDAIAVVEAPSLPLLSSDLWAEILQCLPHAKYIGAATQACRALRDAYQEHTATIMSAIFALPRVQPYCESIGSPAGGSGRYQSAMEIRNGWQLGKASQGIVSFTSYVRCLKVDWESSCGAPMLFVGLFDGTVWSRYLEPTDEDGGPPRQLGAGCHADGQVLCIDVSGATVLSGSGEPSYNDEACAGATLRVVSLQRFPFQVTHELGADDGGHTDSINDILITDGPVFEGQAADEMRCAAVTAASDGMLIVWDVAAGRVMRRCSHGAAVTALARVDDEFILSCGVDGQVREWRWRTGSQVRELFLAPNLHKMKGEIIPLSSMSFHAPTCTLALGNRAGQLSVWRVSPRNVRPEASIRCYPLTAWNYVGAAGREFDPSFFHTPGAKPGAEHEVATIQHDGDKIVCAARSGIFRVLWLGELPDEGMPFGVYTDGRAVQPISLIPFSMLLGASLPQAAEVPAATVSPGIHTAVPVRRYVSTVAYRGHALVADGFDNQVLVLNLGYDDE